MNLARAVTGPAQLRARCFSTLGCGELSLAEALQLATANGVSSVELRILEDEIDLPAYFRRRHGTPGAIQSSLGGSAVKIVALDTSFAILDASEENRAALLSHLHWAVALGARWLRVFDGHRAGLDDREASVMAAETLAWWEEVRVAHRCDLALMVETHDTFVRSDGLRELLEAAPDAALLWDAHNTWRKGGEDLAVVWEAIRGHVVHVHVKDSIGRPSARHPFTYVLPGDGEFPMRALRSLLERDGYGGALSLEWERRWHPYLPPLQQALEVARIRGWW